MAGHGTLHGRAESDSGHAPPPGWYPDARRPGTVRWWDGGRWTDDVAVPEGPAWSGGTEQHEHEGHHGHIAALGEEALHEMDVVAEDVSTPVVLAWFVLVTLLSVIAPLAVGSGSNGVLVMLWVVAVLAAVGGAVPFWRGGHRTVAAVGVAVAVLAPMVALS